jgi:type I restriction enzyme R subunit
VPREEASGGLSLFFDDLLYAKMREFNPRYTKVEWTLIGQFRHVAATMRFY